MNTLIKSTIWGVFFVLIIANIFTFMKGMSIADEINHFESETKKLHQENIELEKQVYNSDSLQNAASLAAVLKFTKQSTPMYLDNMYALNR
jgi:hypothetical protein